MKRPSRISALFPIAARPRILTIKNRYLRPGVFRISHLLGVAFTVAIIVGLYLGTKQSLSDLSHYAAGQPFSTGLINSGCAALFMLVLASASVATLSCFYMSRDIELLVSSPLPSAAFLRGKAFEVGLSAAWIAIVFSTPLYLAFGASTHAHWLYFVCVPIILANLLLVAVLAGILLTIILLASVPARISRVLPVVIFFLALGLLLCVLQLIPQGSLLERVSRPQRTAELYTWLSHPLIPTSWIGAAVESLQQGKFAPAAKVLVTLVLITAGIWSVLAITFRRVYSATYSKYHSGSGIFSDLARLRHSKKVLWCPERLRPIRALVTREFYSFTRDLTHTVQLALLLTISLLYLYNLKGVEAPTHVNTSVLRLWDICLVFSSVALSSIILLSICARFVFPSISLEGQTFWLLQTAPTSWREILRAKYIGWFIPICCISAIVFSAGGLSLGLEPIIIVCLIAIGAILSHGLVALGVGFGARFARFDWEHPTELSTSWGSLIYTVLALVLLGLSMIPVASIIGLYLFFPDAFRHDNNLIILLSAGLGSLWILHFIAGRIGLRIGIKALERMRV
jgi:ABC-2 type transport system permease protein